MNELRQATLRSLWTAAAVAAGLVLIFQFALDPVVRDSTHCNTSLEPSTFKSLLVPIHMLAAAALSASIWMLSARRSGSGSARPGSVTLVSLGLVWAYVIASLIDHDLFGVAALLGVFGGPTLGVLALIILGLRALLVARSTRPPEECRRDQARTVLWLLWGMLLLGIPASLAYAWLRGADAICF